MLMPKKLKHRKQFRAHIKDVSYRGNKINFGSFALKALESNHLTSRQIEAARRAMTRYIKRGGQVWIRVFPDRPYTMQPAETGMGGGKGSLDHFVAVVDAGRIIFEMDGVPKDIAKEALRLAAHKLPMHTKFIVKDEI